MRPIIHSQKHYVQLTLSTITTGALLNTTFIDTVEVADKTTPLQVVEGANVKAIFVEIWAIGSSANQFFTAVLTKVPGTGSAPNVSQMALLNDYENKKNILYTTQGLASNDGIAAPIAIIRQWFKIPKSKQRFGLGDRIIFTLMSRGDASMIICGFALYKEYT